MRERYFVSAPLARRLLRVELKAGDVVARDTLLATLVPAAPALLDARTVQELTERVGVADADALRAEAGVDRAHVALDLARQRGLSAQGFASTQSLERSEREAELKSKDLVAAEFDRHAADHQRSLARAALTRARSGGAVKSAFERWDIRSPVGGRVLRVAQESEAVVAVGAPIVELGDAHNLEVVVDVLTADAVQIQPGAPARLDRGDGSAPLSGCLRIVEPAAYTKVSALGVEEQRVNVVIDLTSPRPSWPELGDACRIDAHIVVEQRSDAVLVPLAALFRRDAGWAVYVIDGSRARLRVVAIGPRNSNSAIVTCALESGERVIVYPGDSVRDGVRVKARAA